jgi:ribosomal protein S1
MSLVNLRVGDVLSATVVEVAPPGVFVQLPQGQYAIVHRTMFDDAPLDASYPPALTCGDVIDVVIIAIMEEENRIGLSICPGDFSVRQEWFEFEPEHLMGVRFVGCVAYETAEYAVVRGPWRFHCRVEHEPREPDDPGWLRVQSEVEVEIIGADDSHLQLRGRLC